MIEKITQQEFDAIPDYTYLRGGRPISKEGFAVRQLAVGEAIKMPCRWAHESRHNVHGSTGCGGRAAAYHAAKAVGSKIRTRCQDKTLYVMRMA